jgi:hypothetical protein
LGPILPALGGGDARRPLALASRRHRPGNSFQEATDAQGFGYRRWLCVAGSIFRPGQTMNSMRLISPRCQNTRKAGHKRLVKEGRKIDLSRAAFAPLADPDFGLIAVSIARQGDARLLGEKAQKKKPWKQGEIRQR